MHLKTPGAIDAAIETVTECIMACQNLHGQMSNVHIARDAYLEWVDRSCAQLGNHLADDSLAEGTFTVRYWEISRLQLLSPRPYDLIRREMDVQTGRLKAVVEKLKGYKLFVSRPGELVVPDTSAFTRGVYFKDFDWVGQLELPEIRIVVPILVVEELDRVRWFEKGDDRHRARQVVKDLRQILAPVKPGEPAELRNNVTVEVFIDDDWHERLQNHDGEIIDQALQIREITGRDVTLTCVDASMEFRAKQRGLHAVPMLERDEASSAT